MLSEEQIRLIVRETADHAARTAVHETLTALGIQHSNPVEMQKDFIHLRNWRVAVEDARHKTFLAVLGILVTGALGALWVGFKAKVGG